MAVLFDDANTQYLEAASAPVVAGPMTVACWYYADDNVVGKYLVSIADSASDSKRNSLELQEQFSRKVRWVVQDGGTFAIPVSSGAYTTNTWQHACGITYEATGENHAAFLNGGGKGTSATTSAPTGEDHLSIGRFGGTTKAKYMSGSVAEVSIWNVALTDAEVAIHAAGYSALFIRPANLVYYDPLIRPDAGDDTHDRVGGLTMTGAGGTGVPVASPHPRIIYPTPAQMVWIAAAAASGRIMSSLAGAGGLAGMGGIAGRGGGLAG